ncbi:hypothetical protein I4U23_010709 [Adineta vaga]|nr:hypothetical protein I4U23_010709 [Adineta vaga]
MKVIICFLILFLQYISTENSPEFCLCTLKSVLQEYSLFTTDRRPPRYRPLNQNDIGFFVVPSRWKAVNNATWIELGAMINAPLGMYSHISIDGENPIQNGLLLGSRQTAHLGEILAEYRLMMDKVTNYYEKIIRNNTKSCLQVTNSNQINFDSNNQWQKYFNN